MIPSNNQQVSFYIYNRSVFIALTALRSHEVGDFHNTWKALGSSQRNLELSLIISNQSTFEAQKWNLSNQFMSFNTTRWALNRRNGTVITSVEIIVALQTKFSELKKKKIISEALFVVVSLAKYQLACAPTQMLFYPPHKFWKVLFRYKHQPLYPV